MANTKEVRKQIASIKSTQKITSAMEMVAASKMKKTQDTMLEGRPYSLKIKDVISHVALANSEYPHPFYEERAPKKACFIVVSSDKGLCGGLNINLFKQVISKSAALLPIFFPFSSIMLYAVKQKSIFFLFINSICFSNLNLSHKSSQSQNAI